MTKRLIVGLGNKGPKYENTRHNAGFLAVDKLAEGLSWKEEKKFNAAIASNDEVIFCKPLTYMNESGTSVRKVVDFFNIQNNKIYIIHDDVDLEPGDFRMQFSRGTAGHHGAESVVLHLGTKDIWRIRLGVGRPSNTCYDIHEWVLGRMEKKQIDQIEDVASRLKSAIFSEETPE